MIVWPFLAKSQNKEMYNQCIVNKYAISPAYAGFSANSELFGSYRQDMTGVPDAPKGQFLSYNAPLYKNSSYGAYITSRSMGGFDFFTTGLSYAFGFKISENNQLFLGTTIEYGENKFQLGNATIAATSDPFLISSKNLKTSFLNAGFGIVYMFKNLQIGAALPTLRSVNFKSASNISIYNSDFIIRLHGSYLIPLTHSFDIETMGVFERYTNKSSSYICASILKYKHFIWLGANVKSESVFGFMIGINPLKKISINYLFEISNSGLVNNSSGNHEITIGILIGKMNNVKYRTSIFGSENDKPYYDWVK
jgi:type IX secretion system PorP/SprF family membrane protein